MLNAYTKAYLGLECLWSISWPYDGRRYIGGGSLSGQYINTKYYQSEKRKRHSCLRFPHYSLWLSRHSYTLFHVTFNLDLSSLVLIWSTLKRKFIFSVAVSLQCVIPAFCTVPMWDVIWVSRRSYRTRIGLVPNELNNVRFSVGLDGIVHIPGIDIGHIVVDWCYN